VGKSKTLCELAKKLPDKLERVREAVRDPQYLCRRCGRAANAKASLCKPTRL